MIRGKVLVFASAVLLAGTFEAVWGRAQSNTQADAKTPAGLGAATLFAELDTSLDSKKAKADEQIVVRTTDALKIEGKVIFPKGTKIFGRVMEAHARGKGDADSLLAIQFDKAVLKGGEEVPVRLAIKAIAPARQFSAGDSAPGQDPMAGSGAGASSSPMGSSRTSSTVPDRRTGSSEGTRNDAGADSGLNNAGQLTPESHGVYGMSGVRLAADAPKTGPVSIVSSAGKNVRLDSGTRLLLVSIADAPASAKH